MLGEAIRKARQRKGWTQPALGRRIKEHYRTVGHWENEHEGRKPDWSALQRLLDVFEDTEFTLAVARFATGGRIGSVAEAICGVRTMVAMATAVEVDELRDDLKRVRTDLLKPETSEAVRSLYLNLLDVDRTSNQMKIELERDYNLTLPEMQRRHLQEAKAKGHISKQKSYPRQRVA